MILVGCGAAAGIAGIFRAPIAGMLFTLEVLMINLTGLTVMPLLLSSIAGATVAYVLEGYSAEFFFSQSEPFMTSRIPWTVALGVVCGLMSVYFTKVMFLMESMFKKVKAQWLRNLFFHRIFYPTFSTIRFENCGEFKRRIVELFKRNFTAIYKNKNCMYSKWQ